ncbi:MAG TPA: flagellar assembly protein FliW [Bryobacteraceae bacterium]|jgi:flagellar assembly factor FliW|nr:flagellar assembly protein FliW [Bryobacteraceae bacterium]
MTTTAAPTICSPWLGEIRLHPDCEIFFPAGLPGFEDERRIAPVEIPAQRPLVYLQSVESERVCFVALPVYVIDRGFRLEIPEEERALLLLPEGRDPIIGEDVLCVLLLMPSGDSVQVNLNSPVVINLHNKRGAQIVRPGAPPAGYRLSADNGWTRLC